MIKLSSRLFMEQTKVKEIDFSTAVGCFVPSIHKLESELPANLRLGVMTL